jgi:hypothetical protein
VNSGLKYVGTFLIGLLAVVLGLQLDRWLFPWQPIKPPLASTAQVITIDIQDLGQGPQAAYATAHRLRHDSVRWVNHTGKHFLLEFRDDPATPDDDHCPLEVGCVLISVDSMATTGLYRVADRPDEHGKQIRFKYHSLTSPLKGPPGDPGMTVED